MKTKKVQLTLPLSMYDELQEIAEASSWSLEEVLLKTIECGMPPTLNKVPVDFHEELMALNGLGDRELMNIAEGHFPADETQDEMRQKADFTTLRRTYALSVLKWRGHPVPPTSFEV